MRFAQNVVKSRGAAKVLVGIGCCQRAAAQEGNASCVEKRHSVPDDAGTMDATSGNND